MTGLRPATPGDLDGIMAIETASFPTDAWSRSSMAATLADRDTATVVASEVDALLGYAAVLAPRGAGDADVLTIAVAEAARGRGFGRALLERLLEEATARGAVRVFLEVRADNPVATALYVSAGFAPIGRRRHYYQPDDVDAVVMRLELPVAVP
ncbi:ribosomal protein S18-alanine N-acetyltransferase [Amnibacterium sp.]|uniref:ribosomal protein S18-alanine N-acetyltransferase n=1 Tax=Amnibacterium sp. TaxID=1872496 RepID=UPI002618CA1A|nr:ribosomal protein S18-alanine N-acetyltransferase [Amnibacterium sp.]MCU1474908.1 acetyltransferase [Amnibacterium sp.]